MSDVIEDIVRPGVGGPNPVIDGIFSRLASRGHEMYGGEAVTQLQHALQCATMARRAGSTASLVTAALLHDYGHVVADDEGAAERGVDMLHEEVAAAHLSAWFGPAVTEPIRMHVAAKRYLCATNAAYFATLSPASVSSLNVQGGPFTDAEAAGFIALPFARDAVRLRVWDDLAKDTGARTPALEDFRIDAEAALVESPA
ncbi:phosphonate degradation HD-domain oxygenase [Microbaculum marinum]|uniref:Phosphonate degradation HD-domain oxygenase n=1 Tax=Microbaculum marinum TaxID=1764581 RepID=A0AAW9RUL1_9HYPH